LDYEVIGNQFEAALWFAISAVLLFKWGTFKSRPRPFSLSLPFAFAVFGVSDVIESHTGAWWDPWWLLVMKAGCVIVFFLAWRKYRRSKRKR